MPLSPVAATPDQRRQATRRLKKEVSVRPWRWRAVQECLLAGAEPDTVGRDGRPVLMDAALAGHVEIMRLLLDMGANVNGTSAAMVTALMEAAATGLTEGCQLLIARGAKADQVDRDGWTALMCAALNGHVDVLRVLLDHGAKVDPTDHRDRTALHHATHNNVESLAAWTFSIQPVDRPPKPVPLLESGWPRTNPCCPWPGAIDAVVAALHGDPGAAHPDGFLAASNLSVSATHCR